MKKIIFFDLDNTIHDKTRGIIPSETLKLLKHLYNEPNTYLGLATGRGPYKIEMIEEISNLFTYKIFINGAIAYDNNILKYKNPLSDDLVKEIVRRSNIENVKAGLVAHDKEFLGDDNLNFSEEIFQVWLFTKDLIKINKINDSLNLVVHPWHKDGADLVDIKTNKAIAIKKLLENEKDYKLICVGDGHNDIDMIEIADIGIAMDNSGFPILKEKAQFIAPHIDKNELYEFFVKHQFFS